MVNITRALVNELKNRTWVGMMKCKKALVDANGDMEKAIEELRKQGLAKARSKADRETSEGALVIETTENKTYVVGISCETDFLANSPRYTDMLNEALWLLKEQKTKEDIKTMIDANYSLEMGENLQITNLDTVEGESFGVYIHSNKKVASVVVGRAWVDEDKLRQVAMHVTALNPEFLSPNDIDAETLAKEKDIQLESMKNDPKMAGKPDNILEMIIEWKMDKFKSEISLLEQEFIINPDQKVKDFIGEDNVVAFYRYVI